MQEVHFETLVLALHCYSGDNKIKYRRLQITCFKENQNLAVEKNLRVTLNFYKKNYPLVFTWNKKHQSTL